MYDNFWQPYMTPYQTRYNAPQQAFGSKLEVIRVNGKNGAEAFQMPPNSSIILLDESAPLIWLKMTDGAGYPTITPYRIEPLKAELAPDVSSLEARIKRLEERLNVKPDTANDEE